MANKCLSFGRISKSHPIFFLNPIIVFVLVVLLGIENDGLAQTTSATSNTESTSSQTCEKLSHCSDNEIKEGNVCVLEPHMFNFQNPNTDSIGTSGYISDLNQTYSCPPDSLVYFTRDINKIMEGLDDVAERCVKIKRLYLSGHGLPGLLGNGLNKSNINQLRGYSCLMADNPIVDLTGCNTGRKCAGKFFMQKTAEALFHNTKGTVIAPNVNFYMVEGVGVDKMGIFRNPGESYTESPFGYNSLTYRPPPPRPPQTTWEQLDNRTNYQDTIMAGLAESRSDEHTSLKEVCVDTIESLIEDIRKVENHYKKEKICQPLLECAEPPSPRPRRKEPAPITTTTTTTPIVEAPSHPQECEKLSHCNDDEIKERHVCIIESGMHTLVGRPLEYSNDYVATYNCPNQEGVDTLTYFIAKDDQDDINGILEQLSDVAQRCTKIKRLYLSGHGVPGSLANGLNRDNVNHLSPYSCLMADNPIVDLAGCSAGKGCSGKLFMQKTAEALFHNTTGTVIAPNVDTLFRVDFGSYARERFAYNSLTFTPPPPSPPQATWKKIGNREEISYQRSIMEGIIQEEQLDEHATIEDQCIDDMSKMVNLIRSNEELHRSRETCEPLIECSRQPYARVISSSERNIRSLENIRSRNRYMHRSFLNLVANNYDNLKRIDEKLFQCDRTCTVRNRREQCTKIEYVRGHTPKTGCRSSDYFLPYSSGPIRSLRGSDSEAR